MELPETILNKTNKNTSALLHSQLNDILLSLNSSEILADVVLTEPPTTTTSTTTTIKPTTIKQPAFRGSRYGTPQSQADALWKKDRKTIFNNWQEALVPHEAFFYVELICNLWFIVELTVRFVVS